MLKPKKSAKEIIEIFESLVKSGEKFAWVLGYISDSSLSKLHKGFSISENMDNLNLLFFFIGRSDIEIEIGHKFEIIWNLHDMTIFQKVDLKLFKVTDETDIVECKRHPCCIKKRIS